MSRRAAEEAVAQGRVKVNGKVAETGCKADADRDIIELDGTPIRTDGQMIYVALYKPKGYVTTLSDEKGRKNITTLVSEIGRRIYPVGRLDMFSEGLIILTNDGSFANRLMHPSHEVNKVYEVIVSGNNIMKSVQILRQPMVIDDYSIKPAVVDVINTDNTSTVLHVTIHEGKNRQVRKMCAAAGLKVINLKRIKEGCVELADLKPGQWRYLTESEVRSFD